MTYNIKSKILFKEWIANASKVLPVSECMYIARSLFEIDVIDPNIVLPKACQIALDWVVYLRTQNTPLAKIIEKKYFHNYCFYTNEHTLDPRCETEILLENVSIKPRTILELGVGSGCLILSAMKIYPKALGLGIDISENALKVAQHNAEILQVKKIEFKQNNWAHGIKGHFDLIFANPPYVSRNATLSQETLHDPELALFGDAQTYEEMFKSMQDIEFYEMLVEIPQNLIDEVETMLKQKIISHHSYKFTPIFDSQIFVLKIENSRNF